MEKAYSLGIKEINRILKGTDKDKKDFITTRMYQGVFYEPITISRQPILQSTKQV